MTLAKLIDLKPKIAEKIMMKFIGIGSFLRTKKDFVCSI